MYIELYLRHRDEAMLAPIRAASTTSPLNRG
jgi:hypothetical protein